MTAVRFRLFAVAAIAVLALYWLLLFLGTHWPMPPKTSIGYNDKLMHAGAYAGLAFLLLLAVRCLRPLTPSVYLLVLAAGATYGVLDELTQRLVPNRSAEVLDWIADVVGLAIGAAAFAALDWLVSSTRRQA